MRSNKQVWWWFAGVGVVVVILGFLFTRGPKVEYTSSQESPRPTQGPTDAPIVLEEFSDFQCPACKSAEGAVKDVLDTFGDRIYFKYRHYPLVTIHTQAFRAALAAECANDQGKFWEYHNVLFENQPNFSRDDLVSYAKQLELKIDGDDGFSSCLDSRAKTDVVRADMREGDQKGVSGTPTFFLNGEQVSDWSQLKSTIQAKLIGG